MWKNLDGKLVADFEKLLRVLCRPDTGRGAGQNDGTGGQGSALREEADQLGNVEDEITIDKLARVR